MKNKRLDKTHRVGLFFGSFNPIHYGHIMIAKYCISHCNLDDLYFVVSPQNPFKNAKDLANFENRFDMVCKVCDENDELFACDFENSLDIPSYTARTVKEMKKINPDTEYVLIMGSDNFLKLDSWKESEYIKCLPMIVILRENGDFNLQVQVENMCRKIKNVFANNEIVITNAPTTNISSTKIRNDIADGYDVSCYTPKYVCDYIKEYKLYQN